MHRVLRPALFSLLTLTLLSCGYAVILPFVGAQESVEDLRQKIADSEAELEKIEAEIRQYEKQLTQVGAEKSTLQNAIRELDLARQKLQSNIKATQQKINSTDLEIRELEREIHVKELEIERNMDAVAHSFQTIDQIESQSFIEMVLGNDSLAEVWDTLEQHANIQDSLREDVRVLSALRDEYRSAKDATTAKRTKLGVLASELTGEKHALDSTREQKDSLLNTTANKEAEYQRILNEKRAAREAFEKAIADYESQIQFILDPTSIPPAGAGVLRWPVDPTFMASCPDRQGAYGNSYCLTQYFGNTAFAKSGAYNGQGHNGIDFGIPTGTKVVSALGGTIIETGNTDAVQGCLSYGKWVLVEHGNGLSTLYAHLSSVSVTAGQSVTTGQLLGHSGNTGYSTGPHLHFTVYASKGVQVVRLGDVKSISGCSAARVPVAGFEAYINPLDYL